jgi:perosamine synthetase
VQAGDEVLLPALTFVGTANPVAAMGAVPHFVDADPDTLGVDPVALDDYLKQHTLQRDGVCINRDTGRPMRALIVVHILGHIGDMEALRALAERHHLKLIEDAAEALGSWRDGRHAGSWGHVAALSFNGNKIITTGGGGAVLSQDPELARRARHLSTTAKQPHPWRFSHDEVGFNYRMPNLNAALGLAQLARLDEFVKAKRALARRYQIAFSQVEGVSCFQEPARDHSNYWLNLLLLDDAGQRDALLQRAHAAGLQLRPFWTPLDQLPMYRDAPSMPLSISTRLFEHGICLPSSPALNMTQEVVCATSW